MATSPAASEIVRQLQAQWADAFNRCDWGALESLYHPEAQLFGGRPSLSEGRLGVRAYFDLVKPGARVVFDESTSTVPHGPDLIVAAGIVDFRREDRPRPHRLTWTLVRTAGGWRIASHHASPLPAPPA